MLLIRERYLFLYLLGSSARAGRSIGSDRGRRSKSSSGERDILLLLIRVILLQQ